MAKEVQMPSKASSTVEIPTALSRINSEGFNKELASHYTLSLSQIKPMCSYLLYSDTYFQKSLFFKVPAV